MNAALTPKSPLSHLPFALILCEIVDPSTSNTILFRGEVVPISVINMVLRRYGVDYIRCIYCVDLKTARAMQEKEKFTQS